MLYKKGDEKKRSQRFRQVVGTLKKEDRYVLNPYSTANIFFLTNYWKLLQDTCCSTTAVRRVNSSGFVRWSGRSLCWNLRQIESTFDETIVILTCAGLLVC